MKKISTTLAVIIIASGIYLLFSNYYKKNVDDIEKVEVVKKDCKNTTYSIAGQQITLKNGFSQIEAAPGSASKITTQYFGNEVKRDFDGDGREDIFFLLTQNTGGSGTFYYAVAALNKESGYIGSDAVFLGDRIAPQSTTFGENNIVIVNYADRAQGESFSVAPSIGKSIWLKLDTNTMKIGEVAQNFEGEADTSKMNITMKTWNWIKITQKNAADIVPIKQNVFKITFKKDGTFGASTDCNGVGGEYKTAAGGKISLDRMISTLMYCEGSQEAVFRDALGRAATYEFTSRGELVLTLKDSGKMFFR